jgi:[DsrC]-trisulfide reductase subunit J
MKLYDGGKVIVALILFLVVACLPLWYNLASGKTTAPPELQLPDPEVHPKCVAPVEFMRGSHMRLLNEWRDAVVRDGERVYEAFDGTKYNMSLSGTCLGCHGKREEFCGKCHGFVGVEPYCWDCHTDAQEIQ